jgi:hypothetical protein
LLTTHQPEIHSVITAAISHKTLLTQNSIFLAFTWLARLKNYTPEQQRKWLIIFTTPKANYRLLSKRQSRSLTDEFLETPEPTDQMFYFGINGLWPNLLGVYFVSVGCVGDL